MCDKNVVGRTFFKFHVMHECLLLFGRSSLVCYFCFRKTEALDLIRDNLFLHSVHMFPWMAASSICLRITCANCWSSDKGLCCHWGNGECVEAAFTIPMFFSCQTHSPRPASPDSSAIGHSSAESPTGLEQAFSVQSNWSHCTGIVLVLVLLC